MIDDKFHNLIAAISHQTAVCITATRNDEGEVAYYWEWRFRRGKTFASRESAMLDWIRQLETKAIAQENEKGSTISELFSRINEESAIQLVPSEDSCQPGYCWKWEDAIPAAFTGCGVFESQEATLISAINYLNDSYKAVVTMNDEAMTTNKKLLLEIANSKNRPSEYSCEKESGKQMWAMIAIFGLTMLGTFGLAFADLFLTSRCVPAV